MDSEHYCAIVVACEGEQTVNNVEGVVGIKSWRMKLSSFHHLSRESKHTTSGFIKEQNRRTRDKFASNGDAAFLPS